MCSTVPTDNLQTAGMHIFAVLQSEYLIVLVSVSRVTLLWNYLHCCAADDASNTLKQIRQERLLLNNISSSQF